MSYHYSTGCHTPRGRVCYTTTGLVCDILITGCVIPIHGMCTGTRNFYTQLGISTRVTHSPGKGKLVVHIVQSCRVQLQVISKYVPSGTQNIEPSERRSWKFWHLSRMKYSRTRFRLDLFPFSSSFVWPTYPHFTPSIKTFGLAIP